MLTDTHCHLQMPHFAGDLLAVLARARQAGIGRILVPGVDVPTSRAALALTEAHAELFAAVGVHPSDAAGWDETTLASLRQLASHPRCVAIGEIGLDYYRDRAPRELQREVFRAQLALAAEVNLPVVIHIRDAWEDVWAELDEWVNTLARTQHPLAQRPGVLHSFDGTQQRAALAAQAGFKIGLSGPVTYKTAHERRAVAAALPLECLLLETDAPYLPPHPHRGQRNEPAYVALVAQTVADARALPLETVLAATCANAEQLLDWRIAC